MTSAGPHVTREVLNQVPPLAGHDVASDPALLGEVSREGGSWAAAELHELGRLDLAGILGRSRATAAG